MLRKAMCHQSVRKFLNFVLLLECYFYNYVNVLSLKPQKLKSDKSGSYKQKSVILKCADPLAIVLGLATRQNTNLDCFCLKNSCGILSSTYIAIFFHLNRQIFNILLLPMSLYKMYLFLCHSGPRLHYYFDINTNYYLRII